MISRKETSGRSAFTASPPVSSANFEYIRGSEIRIVILPGFRRARPDAASHHDRVQHGIGRVQRANHLLIGELVTEAQIVGQDQDRPPALRSGMSAHVLGRARNGDRLIAVPAPTSWSCHRAGDLPGAFGEIVAEFLVYLHALAEDENRHSIAGPQIAHGLARNTRYPLDLTLHAAAYVQ